MDPVTRFVIDHLVGFTSSIIMPLMLFAFVGGVLVRLMIYYVARAEYRFTYEFEKRVRFMTKDMHEDPSKKVTSFQSLVKQLLLKTYYESFELKHRYKRRNYDHISSVSDRMFLVQEGAARIVGDLLKQTRYIKRDSNNNTKMIDMVKNVFDNNPYFNRLMGIVPVGLMNELTSILPGLLIIGGIFGTFLGISRGLPELSAMDLSKIDETKKIISAYLASHGEVHHRYCVVCSDELSQHYFISRRDLL